MALEPRYQIERKKQAIFLKQVKFVLSIEEKIHVDFREDDREKFTKKKYVNNYNRSEN